MEASRRVIFMMLLMLFLSSGFINQYRKYVDCDKIELSEEAEKESESKEKNDKNFGSDFVVENIRTAVVRLIPGSRIYSASKINWDHSYVDIITPPPEII